MGEFELIAQCFSQAGRSRTDVVIGVGDDGAVVQVRDGFDLVVTTDTMVEGVHFFADVDPRALGHKLVAVNVSDLAAMGAEPCWLSLGLTLPVVDNEWLKAFAEGLSETADYYNCQLIGGDTTRGPLSLTMIAKGLVPKGKAITRAGAQNGDYLYQLDDGPFQTSSVFEYVASGLHSVTVIDQTGCSNPITKTDILIVNYPKYFTPNNDGYNDVWKIDGLDLYPQAVISIFDRYGKLLKQLNYKSVGWNGNLNGLQLPSDDYWFQLILYDNQIVNGHFSLKR